MVGDAGVGDDDVGRAHRTREGARSTRPHPHRALVLQAVGVDRRRDPGSTQQVRHIGGVERRLGPVFTTAETVESPVRGVSAATRSAGSSPAASAVLGEIPVGVAAVPVETGLDQTGADLLDAV
jgi:hypothetical protein